MKWIDTTVGDYCPFIYGKGLPQNKRIQGEFPVYGSNGIVDSHSESLIQTPGIIIGRKGSCGAVNISTGAFWPIDTTFYVTKDSLNELYFTYYLLKTLGLETMNSDSAVPGLNRDNAHNVRIRIPEKKEDREKLGYKLSVFDNKIANNTAMNQTLEKIAQRIFKSWFIDFDPVKANAEGVPFNGLSPEIQALFPSEFEESELGMIPKGWNVGSFGELLDFHIGGDWGKEAIDLKHTEIVRIIRGTDFHNAQIGEDSSIPCRYVEKKKLSKRQLADGDIVIEVSGGSPTQPTGRVLKISEALLAQLQIPVEPASFCRLFRPKPAVSHYAYIHLKNLYENGGTWKYQNQSTGIANFQTTYFLETEKLVLPDGDVLESFNTVIEPLLKRIAENGHQNASLRRIKDRLLPRLITGKIQLSDANQELKEAV